MLNKIAAKNLRKRKSRKIRDHPNSFRYNFDQIPDCFMNEDSTVSKVQACIKDCVIGEYHDQETCQSNVDKIYEEFIEILKFRNRSPNP